MNVVFPLRSLISRKKNLVIEIEGPRFVLDESLFSISLPKKSAFANWNVQQIDIFDGEIVYHSQNWDVQLLNFSLHSRKRGSGNSIKLTSHHLKMIVPIEKRRVALEGEMEAEFREEDGNIKINRFSWQTQDMAFNLHGWIFKDGNASLNAQIRGEVREILLPLVGRDFVIEGVSSASAKIVRNRTGTLWINGNFSAPSFSVTQEPLTDLKGKISWDNQSREIRMEGQFLSNEYNSRIRLRSKDFVTHLTLENVAAATVSRILKLKKDLPLVGRIEAGEVEIHKEKILGRAFLNNGNFSALADSAFKITGEVQFHLDRESNEVTFNGKRLFANMGEFSISGRSNVKRNFLQFQVRADIRRSESFTPIFRHYIDLDLSPWNLQGGNGTLFLDYHKLGNAIRMENRFELSRFFSNGQSVQTLTGDIASNGFSTRGSFVFRDPQLSGQAELETGSGTTSIRFSSVKGESQKILKILAIGAALRGELEGEFHYTVSGTPSRSLVKGDFRAQRIFFEQFDLHQLSGHLDSNLDDLRLSGMNFIFSEGKGTGDLYIDFANRRFDLSGSVREMRIPANRTDFSGNGSVHFKGAGLFFQDAIRIDYSFSPMFLNGDRPFEARGEARLYTDFSDISLQSSGQALFAGGPATFSLDVKRRGDKYSGNFAVDLKDLNVLIPWKNNSGQIRILGQLLPGPSGTTTIQGVANFSGDTLALPNFSHAINKFQGFITFNGSRFYLQSFSGELGKGKFEANGQVVFSNYQIQDLRLNFTGRNMELYPMDRVQCKLNADLTLRTQSRQLLLQGNLDFLSVNWEREVDESIAFYTSSALSSVESRILKMLQFDIRMNGSENIQMNNSLGKINGQFNLHLTGNNDFPILTGTMEGRSGEVYFSDRRFNLLKAKLVFSNTFLIDPLIWMESETDIQNYRIRFDIKGTSSHLKPEFFSSPPLPSQDILALISLGEIFRRSGSTEVSSRLGSSAMFSSKVTQQIQNRANKLLGIDMLRIDPLLSGASNLNTFWLTVGAGRLISKNLIVVYSTNLSTSKQQILYFQYQLSPTLSVIGMRNEEGNYSIDLRYRQRR